MNLSNDELLHTKRQGNNRVIALLPPKQASGQRKRRPACALQNSGVRQLASAVVLLEFAPAKEAYL